MVLEEVLERMTGPDRIRVMAEKKKYMPDLTEYSKAKKNTGSIKNQKLSG